MAKNDIRDIFDALEGGWDVARVVSPGGTFSGSAVFNRVGADEYAYEEVGQMTIGDGKTFDAGRLFTYRYEIGQISVYYADGENKGQLFHSLSFDEGDTASGEHQCKDDFYKAKYEFDLPGQFALTYNVKGPKKDYVSRSVFSRAP